MPQHECLTEHTAGKCPRCEPHIEVRLERWKADDESAKCAVCYFKQAAHVYEVSVWIPNEISSHTETFPLVPLCGTCAKAVDGLEEAFGPQAVLVVLVAEMCLSLGDTSKEVRDYVRGLLGL